MMEKSYWYLIWSFIFVMQSVWCLWELIWPPCGASSGTIGVLASSWCGWAHFPQCDSGSSPTASHESDESWLGRPHATIHLLWQGKELDHFSLMGLCCSNFPRSLLSPRNRDAFQDILELVQESRLHGICFQHSSCLPQPMSEALYILPIKGKYQSFDESDSDRVYSAPGSSPSMQVEDGESCCFRQSGGL